MTEKPMSEEKPKCPYCGSDDIGELEDGKRLYCVSCGKNVGHKPSCVECGKSLRVPCMFLGRFCDYTIDVVRRRPY